MKTIVTFEITEVANQCELKEEEIIQYICDDWILPHDREQLLFDEDDINRILLISELKQDLGINNDGVPIVLHLIDQLNHLHSTLLDKKQF